MADSNDASHAAPGHDAERLFRAMFEAAPDAMIGVAEDGRIVMANRRTETLFGYPREELLGRQLEILVPQRARTIHAGFASEFFDDPHVRPMGLGLDLAGLRADGTEFPAEISLSWLPTEPGIIAIAAIRDITKHRDAESELRRAREEADRAAGELAAAYHELQSFSYAVAHDLRAPLRAIHGFGQALVEEHGPALDEGGRHFLDRISGNVARMEGMIDALLNLSRITRAPLDSSAVIDLSALAEDAFEVQRESEPEREVSTAVQPNVTARGDRSLVPILMTNLVSNAWKFTAPRVGARVEFGERSENDERWFYVRDNGIGFDGRYADQLFRPFHRLHSQDFPGSGIGLATAERIVRRHGGHIRAEGVVGEGATILFTLGEDSA